MITPEPTASGGKSEIRVPTSALQVDGVAPAEGEEVEFTGRGRVVRVDGETLTIEPTEINETPVAGPSEPSAEDAEQDMMAMAMKADEAQS